MTTVELVYYLAINKDEIHIIYWSIAEMTAIKMANCFFTNKVHQIHGIDCDTMYPDITMKDKVFADLKSYCGNSNVYFTNDKTAKHNTTELFELVKSANA